MIQVVPALVIVMISLAYLEEDGVLLSIALLIAVVLLARGCGLENGRGRRLD